MPELTHSTHSVDPCAEARSPDSKPTCNAPRARASANELFHLLPCASTESNSSLQSASVTSNPSCGFRSSEADPHSTPLRDVGQAGARYTYTYTYLHGMRAQISARAGTLYAAHTHSDICSPHSHARDRQRDASRGPRVPGHTIPSAPAEHPRGRDAARTKWGYVAQRSGVGAQY